VTLSALGFYLENLVIISGYLFAAIMITRRIAIAQDLSWRSWFAGLSFFLLCGLTHAELAYHAFIAERIIHDDGSVDLHMHLVHIPQALSIWVFLLSCRGAGPRPEDGRLLGLRMWWWRTGQPRSRFFVRRTKPEVPLEGSGGLGMDANA